jgi:molybdopterin synthase sulfur carrier subunit
MAQVHFTAWLRTWAPPEPVNAPGATVGEALGALFEQQPQLRGYLVDERGALRKHVCIFADGRRLAREATMGHPVAPDSKLYVMQALSGG